MNGAIAGGGLGYCGGAGGYLGIGLDEHGNFSNPFDNCTGASGGPGRVAESLVIRGPQSATNARVTTTSVPGGIDNPGVAARPSPNTVLLTLTPAVAPAVGYTITAQFQSSQGPAFQTLFSNVPFNYAAPAMLSAGFSGSTGGKTNVHELQGVAVATPDDLQVTMTGPATALQGSLVTYTVTLTNNGNYTLSAGNAPTVVDTLPATVSGVSWTCAGSGGGSCDASGTGNLNTTSLTVPANGSVTYTLTGTLDPAAICGSTLANTANGDFNGSTNFLDPDETNNSATVNSTITCDTTLVANPGALVYQTQQVNVASSAQAVTLTEGNNGTATITGIAVSGDYAQTNNCPATLAAAQSCTVNVVFTPTALGSRNGTLTIQSNLADGPTITSVVTLSGTGVNTAPNAFSFTPLINVDPSSVQVSNAITVANTDAPAPISVSAGGQYSLNGGPFTALPGVVQPGDAVTVQMIAPSSYNTTASAVLTIGGVMSTYTVTTAAQPLQQPGFTPVLGASVSSTQISNAVTVTNILASAAISISAGSEYSINGGPFTSSAGTVQPGDQVRVEVTAPATYGTTATAALTIGGAASSFAVTTGAEPVLQGSYTAVTGAAVSSAHLSNAITVTGITSPTAISVSSGAQYSINNAAFTSVPGTVQAGDQVRLQSTAPSTYETTVTAVLTIDGVSAKYSVTTGAQPLQQVAVTGGGGAIGMTMLLMLTLIAFVRIAGPRHGAWIWPVVVAMLTALSTAPAHAADVSWLSNLYGGIRVGDSTSNMSATKLANGLRSDGFQVTAAGSERGTASGTFYMGYEVRDDFAVELAGAYLGRVRAALTQVPPGDLHALLSDAAHIVRGSGDIIALEARYRWCLARHIDLDLRGGPYVWITHTDVYVSGVDELSRRDRGVGYTLGAGPRFALGEHVGIGVGADYLQSTADNHFVVFSASLEYHFR